MTSVRKTTKTTVTLLLLTVGIAMLMKWSDTRFDPFFNQMRSLLTSKGQIGAVHSFTVQVSFWLLLIASCIEAVFREKNGLYILGCFGAQIVFSCCVAVWGTISISKVNIVWFWLFCYVGLIICNRVIYGRLSSIKGAGPVKIKLLLKSPPSKNGADVSIIDRSTLYVAKVLMIIDWFLLLISLAIFCVQYKHTFGL